MNATYLDDDLVSTFGLLVTIFDWSDLKGDGYNRILVDEKQFVKRNRYYLTFLLLINVNRSHNV